MTPALLRAFIVEDSPVITVNLIATLEELTAVNVVGTAPDEESAVSWLRAHCGACELVIIDIFLSGGSGLGVLRAAAQLPAIPTLAVLTNYATPAIRAQCMELGADKVFDKSNELDELIEYCVSLEGN